jgi:hypothetical protein
MTDWLVGYFSVFAFRVQNWVPIAVWITVGGAAIAEQLYNRSRKSKKNEGRQLRRPYPIDLVISVSMAARARV